MTTVSRAKDREKILEVIKSAKRPLSKREIVEKTNFDGDFAYAMKQLIDECGEIKALGSRSARTYIWSPANEVYSEMKNPEGYPDGTAGKAIANVMKNSSNGKYPMRQRFGEVWSCFSVVDDMEGYLIISAKDGVIVCCNVYPSRKGFMKPEYTVKWTDKIGNHYVSIINLVNLTERKVDRMLYEVDDDTKALMKEKLYSSLGIEPEIKFEYKEAEVIEKIVEKPVEVIKEVPVEVPVEVVKEVEVIKEVTDPNAIELAVLKAKCEIYEKLIFGGHLDGIRQKD